MGIMPDFARNRERLDFWKGRYGITDTDIKGEHVNDVNITAGNESIMSDTAQELGFGDKKDF